MLFAAFTFLLLRSALAQISCPGLGDFNPDGAFVGWPDPTCPGDTGLDLTYRLFSRRDLLGRDFDRNTVPNIFEPDQDTVFVTHGHDENGSTLWLRTMMNALLDVYNINVVIVGWGDIDGAQDPEYSRAASDTRTVGAETAEVMINLVVSGGSSPIRMHLVGHGLGAHVMGHAGRWADEQGMKPQRITGLDPAGPSFIDNTNRSVGLYNDCANFVDIIHTDQEFGSTPSGVGATDVFLGDQDFFPNGGVSQPGCTVNRCDHDRAREFFLESLSNNCMDATLICTDSSDLPDSCSACGPCPRMGYSATSGANGRFYLTSTEDPPYC